MQKQQKEQRKYSAEEVREIAEAFGFAEKSQPLHGPNYGSTTQFGPYSGAGVRPDMFSAAQRTRSFLSLCGLRKTDVYNALLDFRTGDTAGSGNASTGWCSTPPTGGQELVAQQIFPLGSMHVGTGSVQLPDVGQRRTYGDVPRNILNAPPTDNPLIPEIMWELQGTTQPESVLRSEMFQVGKRIEIETEKVAIQGSGATANIWFSKFSGVETQVATGKTDSVSLATAPALDSVVVNYNAALSSTIIDAVTESHYAVKDRASQNGIDGIVHAVVGPRELFRALVEQWACSYDTDRCAGSTSQPNFTNAAEVNRLRLEMLNGSYLLIDGERVPFVASDGVEYTRLTSSIFRSDLFILPVSWQGMPLMTLEYFDMGNASIAEFANFAGMETQILNDGMYLVGKEKSSAFCLSYEIAAKMRFILETPWLAARVDNIQYTYTAATRRADPDVTFAHAAGGTTFRS